MFNPLAPLSERALKGLIRDGHRFFVRQSFSRGVDPFEKGIKGSFLFCHYKVYTHAKEHYDALLTDPYRFLYDWEDEEHQEKLRVAASQPFGYKLYTNTFVEGWEHRLTPQHKKKIKAYVERLGWRPGKDDTVDTSFHPHFGAVHITLRFQKRKMEVNFEEIENLP